MHTAAATTPRRQMVWLCALLTACVPLVHGYHPYAEDGGIYLAGIKRCLRPELYAYDPGFVDAHVHFSVFAHALAMVARVYPPALMGLMFALYLLAAFTTLLAAACVAEQIIHDAAVQRWAVVLLAACLSIPVAGTSLMLMDPYVTARSLALPCVLAAFAMTLRGVTQGARGRDIGAVALALAAAAILHPLSAGYGAAAVALLVALSRRALWERCAGVALVAVAAVGLCVALRFAWSDVPPGYTVIAETRSYWALSNWAWYEVAGVVAPVLLFLLAAQSRKLSAAGRLFATAMAVAGLLSLAVSLISVHPHGPFAVARVQPLRMFQYLYIAMPLCLGAWLLQSVRHRAARAVLCVAVAGGMFASQRAVYASTNHVEWPWSQPGNVYEQAFLWVRDNTPLNAVVAVDARYISASGEDAHNMRALTERSVPADMSKDGGIAAIRPELTQDWYEGVALQNGLSELPDSERVQRLRAHGVAWVVLPLTSQTSLPCPYHNAAVAVCRVPAFVHAAK